MTENSSSRDYDRTTSRSAPFRGPFGELWRWFCYVSLKIGGWKLEGDWPDHPKMVLVAAPHTSNWDGIWMLAAVGYYRAKVSWMGKKSLTTGLFGGIVKWLGCIPIDRNARHDVVGQMVEAFATREKLTLLVPPEGTRGQTAEWKTGFYHIANKAGVPIVMTVLDWKAKTVRISGETMPSGEYDVDIPDIKRHYAGVEGKHKAKFAVPDTPNDD